jgi:hypothetical protein
MFKKKYSLSKYFKNVSKKRKHRKTLRKMGSRHNRHRHTKRMRGG